MLRLAVGGIIPWAFNPGDPLSFRGVRPCGIRDRLSGFGRQPVKLRKETHESH